MDVLHVNGKRSLSELVMTVLAAVLIGGLAALLIQNYVTTEVLFGVMPISAYLILAIIILALMGTASYRAKLTLPESAGHTYYAIMLLAMFLWHISFFRLGWEKESFGVIIAYIFLSISTFFEFDKADKISGLLLIPSALWGILTAFYNFSIIK